MMRLVTSVTGPAVALLDVVWSDSSETLETDTCSPDGTPTVFNIHSLVPTTLSQSMSSLSAGLTGPLDILLSRKGGIQHTGDGSGIGRWCGR